MSFSVRVAALNKFESEKIIYRILIIVKIPSRVSNDFDFYARLINKYIICCHEERETKLAIASGEIERIQSGLFDAMKIPRNLGRSLR